MIEGYTILCFASGYDAPPTSKHHVMHLLAERNTVLWINYHASRVPVASSSDLLYMAGKLKQVFSGMYRPRKNLYVLTPLVIPLPACDWARKLNRFLLISQIRWAMSRIRRGPLQIWTFTPDISYALENFGEQKVVYYCVDDHAEFSGYNKEQVLNDEEDLCRRADLVVTTSLALQEAKKHLNPNTILVPHGVDYEHFAQAVSNDLAVPKDIADIGHPRLGFFGLIRDWVDLGLLGEVARRRPDWHIVLLGDSTVDLSVYKNLSNMHFLGRKPYEELPAYCRQFDVGLIPFQVNELTRAVNPIKLREYLAAGLPVVSTPMPEVEQYNQLISIADSADAFMTAVEAALADDPTHQKTKARTLAMRGETWSEKLSIICDYAESRSGIRKGNP